MRRHGGERLGEAPLDRLRELRAQLLELLQARLQVGALGLELGQPLLLELVLLLGERVDLAELDPPRLEPLDASRQLGAIVARPPALRRPRRVACAHRPRRLRSG